MAQFQIKELLDVFSLFLLLSQIVDIKKKGFSEFYQIFVEVELRGIQGKTAEKNVTKK